MNTQTVFVMAFTALAVCSVAFMLVLPALASAAVHGNRRGGLRLAVLLGVLTAAAVAISIALGANPEAYSTLA